MVSSWTRRDFGSYLLGGSVAVTGAMATARSLVAETRELVIVSYGGSLQEPHQWLARRMEARHEGLKITLVASESQEVVAQIKAARGRSPYDAMPNGEPPHLIGIKEGYIQPARPESLPNYESCYPSFIEATKGYGVPATYSLIGIAYNTDLAEPRPVSWQDLWRDDYAGMVGICRPSSNLGLGTLAIANRVFGGGDGDLATGWAKLEALKPAVARSPGLLTQMLERGEIGIAPLWNNDAAVAASNGLPIGFVKPEPGPVAIISCMSEITGTAHPRLVHEWMNEIISREYQAYAAAAPYFFGATVRGVDIPARARTYTPSTAEEVKALQIIDWNAIVPIRGEILTEFDRLFSL